MSFAVAHFLTIHPHYLHQAHSAAAVEVPTTPREPPPSVRGRSLSIQAEIENENQNACEPESIIESRNEQSAGVDFDVESVEEEAIPGRRARTWW